jgi:hypothetical protein
MTLSNFDWTDKDSVKWFTMLTTGHEGPYSLNTLIIMRDQKKISPDVKIWAEGLTEALPLKKVLSGEGLPVLDDGPPDLPPLPDDDIPPIPLPEEEEEIPLAPEPEEVPKKSRKVPTWVFVSVAAVLMLYFAFGNIFSGEGAFNVSRLPKMALELHERILRENKFDGWDKKIFFKEYLPDDHTHIWLVTSSFQECQVEATFNSLQDKLLSTSDEKVSFKTKGHLRGHIVEFSAFDFTTGSKIIPGMYEMDVKATHCKWDGFKPLVMNKFISPDAEYMARTKVVLFSKGAEEFNKILDRLIKKKAEVALKEQNRNEIFWQDLQQKLETLQAITLQIEQHLLDFLDGSPASFTKSLKPMVDVYTRKFGSFLTTFVVENDNYFKNLSSEAKGISKKRNYELIVRLSSKRIGLETMKFIEEFQASKKNPTQSELQKYSDRVKKTFQSIKQDLNQKLIQISEDRSS